MKADICFSNDRQQNDFSRHIKAQTNLGFLKIDYGDELKIKIFWVVPLPRKKKDTDEKKSEDETEGGKKDGDKKKEEAKPKKNILGILAGNTDGVKAAVGHLIAILKKCKVKLRDTEAAFSTGSPDTDGYTTAVLSALPFLYAPDVKIRPDFNSEDAYFDGHVNLYIRIYTFKILIQLIRMALDRDFMKLIKELRG